MTQPNNQLPALTEDVAKMQINIDLTKSGIAIQNYINEEATLVYNDDNLPKVIDYVSRGKTADKVVEKAFDRIVAKPKEEIKAAKKVRDEMQLLISGPFSRAEAKMKELQAARERKKKEQNDKIEWENSTRQGIAANLEFYSKQIADCDTIEKIRAVENRINLEKANKGKYKYLYDEAKLAYETLTKAITEQKVVIKEKIELADQLKTAIDTQDDQTAMDIQEKLGKLDDKIEENKIHVQEAAINTVMNQTVSVADEIIEDLDYKMRYWSYEVVDIKEVAKKRPDWVETIIVKGAIQEFKKEHTKEWNDAKKTEVIVDGIKFIRNANLA